MSSTIHKADKYTLVSRAKSEAARAALDTVDYDTNLLAEYDKRGGKIVLDDGTVVPNGTFWDFENACPRKKPLSLPIAPKKTLLGKAKAAVKKVVKGVRGKK